MDDLAAQAALIDRIAYDYKHPKEGEADRNGNMRFTVLREKYLLSAVKLQKILVTAGVYEPVKKNTPYEQIKKMREEGKTVDEIVAATGLSYGALNAYLPYESGIYNVERIGEMTGESIRATGAALRKRKQRDRERAKKENARSRFTAEFSDEAFWRVIGEHGSETFVTSSGQRFRVKITGKESADIILVNSGGESGEVIHVTREGVLAGLHDALELKAGELEGQYENLEEYEMSGEYRAYILPLLIFFGIIKGDRNRVTTRRGSKAMETRCSCCGKRTERVFEVHGFDDLVRLDAQFSAEREAALTEEEREARRRAEVIWGAEHDTTQAELEEKKRKEIEAARASRAVRMFDAECAEEDAETGAGGRALCEWCASVIYMALKEGDAPYVSPHRDFDDLSVEAARSYFRSSLATSKDSYVDIFGTKIEGDKDMMLFKAFDREGVEHTFQLTYSTPGNGAIVRATAMEIHRLTKAGRVAKDNTDTDYEIHHFRFCYAGDDRTQKTYVTLIELENKVQDALNTITLTSEPLSPRGLPVANNSVKVGDRAYNIESIGTIVPVSVGSAMYMSLRSREWDGGDYGFLIDGKLFSGNELALMLSSHEGWRVNFWADGSNGVLKSDEYLMPVRLSKKVLEDETIELINMFTADGRFISEHDRKNFGKVFERVLEKLKIYHKNSSRGYGRLAGMGVIRKLRWVDGMEPYIEKVKEVIRE